jgi:hypothetical protein
LSERVEEKLGQDFGLRTTTQWSGFWIEDDDTVEPRWWRCDVAVDGDAVSIVGSGWVGPEGQGVG